MLINNNLVDILRERTFGRTLKVYIDGAAEPISQSHIVADSFEWTSSVMDEETFALGGCYPAQVVLQLVGVPLTDPAGSNLYTGKPITVSISQEYSDPILYPGANVYPAHNLYPLYAVHSFETQIFKGTIVSAKRTKNRAVIELVAYDELYRLSKMKCKGWLQGYIAHERQLNRSVSNMNLINALMETIYSDTTAYHFSTVQNIRNADAEIDATANDVANRADDNLTVAQLLQSFCELVGAYGYVDTSGTLTSRNLYTLDNNGSTQPLTPVTDIVSYTNLTLEDYQTSDIQRVEFLYQGSEKRAYGTPSGNAKNTYSSDNVITRLCSDITDMLHNLITPKNLIFYRLYQYRPFSVECFGEWWIEPGEAVRYTCDGINYTGLVLSKTVKGVNNMRVTLEAKGTQFFNYNDDEVNYPDTL